MINFVKNEKETDVWEGERENWDVIVYLYVYKNDLGVGLVL